MKNLKSLIMIIGNADFSRLKKAKNLKNLQIIGGYAYFPNLKGIEILKFFKPCLQKAISDENKPDPFLPEYLESQIKK